jgi:ADP-ribose pyrophosphatase
MPDDVEVLSKTTPFRGYFRIDRYVLRHRRYDGGWTPPMTRELFERGHAVAVLLYDPIRDEVGLIEQFRIGALAAGWHPWIVEVVAGIIDDGETPEEVLVREAREEAGAAVDEFVPVGHFVMTPGGSSETVQLYCARVDASKLAGFHGLEHEGEDIRVITVPADEAIGWVASGKICNAITAVAVQWLALNRSELRARWK